MSLHVSDDTRPSSGGSAQMQFHRNLHAVNTHPTHEITLNSIRAESPEEGPVTPETCRHTDS
jgi:hypothetical protein